MEDNWTPSIEWEAETGDPVVDRRHGDGKGRTGTVVRCDQLGHFADPYWLADVHWGEGGYVERDVNTIHLTRPDGSQGRRRPASA